MLLPIECNEKVKTIWRIVVLSNAQLTPQTVKTETMLQYKFLLIFFFMAISHAPMQKKIILAPFIQSANSFQNFFSNTSHFSTLKLWQTYGIIIPAVIIKRFAIQFLQQKPIHINS